MPAPKDSIDERAKQAAAAFAVDGGHSFSITWHDEYNRHAAAVKEKASAVKTLLGRAPQLPQTRYAGCSSDL